LNFGFFKKLPNCFKWEMHSFYVDLMAAAIIIYLAVCAVTFAYYSLLSFDGAINFQVSANLAKIGRYATSYDGLRDFGGYRARSPYIETGGPVLLPAALLFRIFGVSMFAAQLPNAIYLVLLAILIYLFAKRLTRSAWFGLIALLAFLSTPRFFKDGMGGLGEFPALFFLLLFLYKLFLIEINRDYRLSSAVLGGLFFGLAYLTKTVMLIIIPALSLVVAADIIIFKRLPLRTYLGIAVGFGGIVASFELYKLATLGLDNYFTWWWGELRAILGESGVRKGVKGFYDTPGLVNKVFAHLSILSPIMKLPLPWIIFYLVSPYLSFALLMLVAMHKNLMKKFSLSQLILTGLPITYFVWWIFITATSRAWLRRIIDGIISHQVVTTVILGTVFLLFLRGVLSFHGSSGKADKIPRWCTITLISVCLLLASCIFIQIARNIIQLKIVTQPRENRIDAEQMARVVADLPPNAKIYGYGWWQCPRISFLTGRSFFNLLRINRDTFNTHTHNYFINRRSYVPQWDKEKFDNILNRSDTKLIFATPGGYYYLYRIYHLYPSL
jgi:hypothetical protein